MFVVKEKKKYNEFEVTPELLGEIKTLNAEKNANLTLSAYLEQLDPSEQYSGALAELSALERQLYKKGVVLKADFGKGILPTKLASVIDSNDVGLKILFAEYVYSKAKESLFSADKYNLDMILANTRYIDGDTARALVIDYSEIDNQPKFKGSAGAELPRVTISWSEETVGLAKSGVIIDFTEEFVRRARIDMVSKLMDRLSLNDRKKQFNYAVKEGLYNGSTSENVSAYGVGAGDYIDYAAWLKWLNSFGDYTCNVVLGDINAILKIVLMEKPNLAPGDVLAALNAAKANNEPYVVNSPNLKNPPALMVVDDGVLPADTIVGIDNRFALERLIESGSEINEIEKFATKGVTSLVVSMYDGYTKFMSDAIKALVIKGA